MSDEIVENAPHGTPNGYFNYKCRCEPCKAAGRAYQLPRTKDRWEKGLEPSDPRHGSYNGYLNYGCRCNECREANRVYAIGYRLKRGLITEDKARELIAKGTYLTSHTPVGWMTPENADD